METVKDHSYGVVPVIKRGDVWKVLLVHQISYRGLNDRFWTFPKGHPDEEETATETARRELAEETGVTAVRLDKNAVFSSEYDFVHEGKRIEKTVTYFLGICEDTNTEITMPKEIAALEWCTFVEAAKKLAHKNTQEVLLAAGTYIQKHKALL